MSECCPYCGREYETPTGLYTHALTEHRAAVLSVWTDEHGISPTQTGQQSLREVTA
ncbi:hypothetical protein GRX03_06040 [Halovenus sp. WSH3]|uniref:C2H2-type domain-containing protein n=1 Tax=Halovenus carboxidivorans TaxID=2692199 RepID=A0A6B0T4Q9_9EURY|nr:hypothetical protein [Halovenus carboxidivorans]MXR51166.1 hypothetical protein [Halovenus carboxidivorans]